MDDETANRIVNKRVRALAADHGLTVPETLAALDKHPIELDRDQFLRRTLAMELIELDRLQQAFRDKALEDRDVGSGLLLLKVAERRATLLGLNAPQGHAVQVIQHEAAAAQTSTEKIRLPAFWCPGSIVRDLLRETLSEGHVIFKLGKLFRVINVLVCARGHRQMV